ncbi:MAG: tryptophan 7-halogenase [Alphaproteobacteria bacterium]|nr:MAG: tryptophan 7-halogenase [Alphaproteobacteria bacterium]
MTGAAGITAPAAANAIRHVLVVGGGTAGWLTACHLAKKLGAGRPDGVKVTLIESPDIPTIGVGEGTVPAIRRTLADLGIRETDFIRACDVTFKQSIRFDGWVDGTADDRYHHIFDYPAVGEVDLTPYWLLGEAGNVPFADAVSVQAAICERGLGPKTMAHAEYDGAASYAYHLDAAKFAAFLTRHATEKLGVTHLLGHVGDVRVADDGHISAVATDRHGTIEADLFVDCTGFAARLVGQALKVPFIPRNDILFCDHAVAAQVPYANADAPIASSTIATARDAGWIWDIGLTGRRGTGYVYAEKYTSHEDAEATLRDYLRPTVGAVADEVACRRIPMRVGYREKFWVGNCVAIGLAQGFVEPLEATGLLVYDATARMLADQFPPSKQAINTVAERFNARVRHAWDKVIDFIKLHYCLSQRSDTQFWRDNRDAAGIPDSLRANLELWAHQPPRDYDFPSRFEIFNLENYLYVLYGMRFETSMAPIRYRYGAQDTARAMFAHLRQATEQACSQLLPNRALIDRIQRHGLQRV